MKNWILVIGLVLMPTIAFAQAKPEGPACGDGPHEIKIHMATTCPCNTKMQPNGVGEYIANVICPAEISKCYTAVKQEWTDWPECKGEPVKP